MENWKPAKRFPNYMVSDKGRIRNARTLRDLSPSVDDRGYARVCIRQDGKQHTVRIHRLVAETFLGEHPGMDVRFKDGDYTKYSLDNLIWSTRQETVLAAKERKQHCLT